MSASTFRAASPRVHDAEARAPASEFRRARSARRRQRGELLLTVLAVVAIASGVVVLVEARPLVPGASVAPSNPSAPPIRVNFGTANASTVPCGTGGTVTVERIPWINTTEPITTGEADLRLTELYDGDYIGDPGSSPNVNATSVCTGAVPSPATRWYAVLENPNGTNGLSYTVAGGWVPVGNGSANVPIPNGVTLVVVENPSLVASGFGMSVVGYADGAPISGSVVL